MPTNRKVVFANEELYHVFNRGVEKRPTFTNKRELDRGVQTIDFYRFTDLPIRLSKFLTLPASDQSKLIQNLNSEHEKLVEIICYCLMPNHFHLLLKQKKDRGISIFAANFANSYTKYFNAKNERVGPLFQGLFQAVHIGSDEQLMHVSRYIHLNPVSSFLIEPKELESYLWSSYPEYLGLPTKDIVEEKIVLDLFASKEKYKQFVLDQVDYARKLEQIKHLTIEKV